jgi:glucosamine--fructose-6-phosphate aminotransferase (isomerizing)
MSLHTEILEQPARLKALLQSQRPRAQEIAAAIKARQIKYVFLAARGTSDNAGRYANYVWGARNHLPMALAAPSLFTYYNEPPRLDGALVMGVSQSGASPDIVSVLAEGQRQGCLTLAVTNEPDSALANVADLLLDIQAGIEKAVAASKTYTAELMSLAMISAAMSGEEQAWQDLARVPDWISAVLEQDQSIARMAERFRYMQQCVVIGRGYNYSTAFEWALKMKELTYVVAEPYSSADFQHGPIAIVEGGFPVMAVVPSGKVFDSLMEMLTRLRHQNMAELVVISDNPQALALAQSPIRLPEGMPEWLTPMAAIVAAQLFACHLTVVKGFDTESPRGLHKVTETH